MNTENKWMVARGRPGWAKPVKGAGVQASTYGVNKSQGSRHSIGDIVTDIVITLHGDGC